MVPGPGVIDGSLDKMDTRMVLEATSAKILTGFLNVTAHQKDRLMLNDGPDYICIACLDLFHFIPERILVRPCKLHESLFFPFCR